MGHLIDLIQDNFHDHWDATILPLTHGRQGGNGLSLLKFWPYVYLQHSLQVHRLIVVDEGQKMYGVVSLSDILNFLVLKPFGKRACVYNNLIRHWSIYNENDFGESKSILFSVIFLGSTFCFYLVHILQKKYIIACLVTSHFVFSRSVEYKN